MAFVLTRQDLALPSGRALGCAGTTPAARFRHSASIANAKSGSGHFANSPTLGASLWTVGLRHQAAGPWGTAAAVLGFDQGSRSTPWNMDSIRLAEDRAASRERSPVTLAESRSDGA